MDLAAAYDEVVSLATSPGTPREVFARVVEYLTRYVGADMLRPLQDVPIEHDVVSVRRQLAAVMADGPPTFAVGAYYFGLFDTFDPGGAQRIGFYVAGVARFEPDKDDWLCKPRWWPEGRYLRSHALDAIKEAEVAAQSVDSKRATFLGYAGQLGIAIVVTRFASDGLVGSAPRVVGFDAGDTFILDAPAKA